MCDSIWHHLENEMRACGVKELTVMQYVTLFEAFGREHRLTLAEELAKLTAKTELEHPVPVIIAG